MAGTVGATGTDGVLAADQVQRVLVVMAHPDDVDFGAGGTVASWTDAGAEVTYCICTDGDAGGFDPAVERSEIPALRRAEQVAAAKQLGVHDVRFLGHPDGAMTVSMDLRRDISRVIRQVRPLRVLAQSPERNWARLPSGHPDHLAAGEAATCAVYPDARNPFAHPGLLADEGLDAWTVRELWLQGHPAPDHHVDVTGTFDRKIEALRAHGSQTAHMQDLDTFVRGWATANAEQMGLGAGRLAEVFKVVTIR